jgi:peptidoglycan-N-acetylglucosamine deacetylase
MTRGNLSGGKRRAALMMTILAGALVVNGCRTNVASPAPAPSPPTPPGNADLPLERFWAFTAPWDARSDSSLRAHRSELDAAVTGWIQLDSVSGRPELLYPDNPPRNGASVNRFALVTTWHGQGFHPELVRRLGARPKELAAVASRLGRIVASHRYQGIVLDLEQQSAADTALAARVVRTLADSARSHGASTIVIALPAADTAAYPTRAFFPAADFALIMLYDEHWSTSAPGPVATPDWVRRTLAQRIADVGVEHIVAALPLYGYLWRGSRPAEPLGFADARRAAAQANVEIVRDPASRSLHAIQPGSWELWSADAELLSALRHEVATLGVTRIALWRLGQEDPGVWPLIARWSVPR